MIVCFDSTITLIARSSLPQNALPFHDVVATWANTKTGYISPIHFQIAMILPNFCMSLYESIIL